MTESATQIFLTQLRLKMTDTLKSQKKESAHKIPYGIIALVVQGNTNFQGILDWILQILHYYCRKQHKNVKNSQIIEQNLVLFLPFSLFTATCSSCHLPWRQSFSISWTQYSVNFKRHTWSFVLYIVSFSGFKMIFSKIS